MRWLLALDLAKQTHGALELAAWLGRASAPQQFVAIHLLDERLRGIVSAERMNELVLRASHALDAAVGASPAAPSVIARRVVTADSPEHGLAAAVESEHCDAMIIGRIAEREGRQLVRLGRVARRLLRRLPRPIAVVPPDVSAASLGSGAVLLTTELGTASRAAAGFALRLASSLERELVVVHVDPALDFIPTFWGEPAVIPGVPRRTPTDVDEWARSVGLGTVRTRLAFGSLVDNVLDIAKLEDAPIIVCGSRGLDTIDRIFVSSTGAELARHADRPVVLVPSR